MIYYITVERTLTVTLAIEGFDEVEALEDAEEVALDLDHWDEIDMDSRTDATRYGPRPGERYWTGGAEGDWVVAPQ